MRCLGVVVGLVGLYRRSEALDALCVDHTVDGFVKKIACETQL